MTPTTPEPRGPRPLDAAPGPAEAAALDRLADELRAAVPAGAPLDAEFAEALRARLGEQPWTLRSALRERPLLRVAAALLILSTVAAPVSALVLLIRPAPQPETELSFELPPPPLPILEEAPPQPQPTVVPPQDPGLADAFGIDWQRAVARSNRMAVVVEQWRAAQAGDRPEEVPAAPPMLAWHDADVDALVREFRRRAWLGLTSPPPSSLTARLDALRADGDEAALPVELRAWLWVLHGEAPPVPAFFGR